MTRVAEILDELFPGPFCLIVCKPEGVTDTGETVSSIHRIHNFTDEGDCLRLLEIEAKGNAR